MQKIVYSLKEKKKSSILKDDDVKFDFLSSTKSYYLGKSPNINKKKIAVSATEITR